MTPEERHAAKKASQKKWRDENKARVAAGQKAWRARNAEKVAADHKTWRAENPERARQITNEAVARWEARNPEIKRARNARWRAENPELTIEAAHRRRARLRETLPDFTVEQWEALLEEFGYACAYCQARDVPLEREHMTPISRGGRHTASNVVPACRSCNARKGAKNLLEFLAAS